MPESQTVAYFYDSEVGNFHYGNSISDDSTLNERYL